MTKDEEKILDEQLSPHRLAKPVETPAIPPCEPDPLREPIARALARRFRTRVHQAWSAGVLDTYGPDDVCELLADLVAEMICAPREYYPNRKATP